MAVVLPGWGLLFLVLPSASSFTSGDDLLVEEVSFGSGEPFFE